MKIQRESLLSGARKAKGIAVVIDVFRAFTMEACALSSGVREIIATDSPERAMALARDFPDALLAGEVGGIKVEGFDFGNSPAEILQAPVAGQTLIHSTSAGTKGLLAAARTAEMVFPCSLVCAGALVSHIRKLNPELVTLVAMGDSGLERTAEDEQCALYLESLLLEKPFDVELMRKTILEQDSAMKFLDPEKPWFPEADLPICLDSDRYDFFLRCEPSVQGYMRITRGQE